jgi:hypothetical protein
MYPTVFPNFGFGQITYFSRSNEILGWGTAGVSGGANASFLNLSDDARHEFSMMCFGSRPVTDAIGDAGGILALLASDSRVALTGEYTLLWNTTGIDGGSAGACWLPVAPDGYVALGVVFTAGVYPSFPTVIVTKELVHYTNTTTSVWTTAGIHGGSDLSLMCAPALLQADGGDDNIYYISAGTCLPVGTQMPMLKVKFPWNPPPAVPPVPPLTSIAPPPPILLFTPDGDVTVPYFAVAADNDKGNIWKVENSPFYTIQRQLAWKNIVSGYNQPGVKDDFPLSHSFESGVTTSATESFSHTVGVNITAATGISIGVNSSIEISLNYEFNYTSSTSRDDMSSETIQVSHDVPPGKNGAIWTINRSFQVARSDGSLVNDGQVTAQVAYDSPNYAYTEFPN